MENRLQSFCYNALDNNPANEGVNSPFESLSGFLQKLCPKAASSGVCRGMCGERESHDWHLTPETVTFTKPEYRNSRDQQDVRVLITVNLVNKIY